MLSNAGTAGGVDDIGRHLLDPSVPLTKQHKEGAVDSKLFDGYVGKYQLEPNFVITISRDGGHLFAQATNQPKFEIFPEGEGDYFFKAFDAQVTFVVDGKGPEFPSAQIMLLTAMAQVYSMES